MTLTGTSLSLFSSILTSASRNVHSAWHHLPWVLWHALVVSFGANCYLQSLCPIAADGGWGQIVVWQCVRITSLLSNRFVGTMLVITSNSKNTWKHGTCISSCRTELVKTGSATATATCLFACSSTTRKRGPKPSSLCWQISSGAWPGCASKCPERGVCHRRPWVSKESEPTKNPGTLWILVGCDTFIRSFILSTLRYDMRRHATCRWFTVCATYVPRWGSHHLDVARALGILHTQAFKTSCMHVRLWNFRHHLHITCCCKINLSNSAHLNGGGTASAMNRIQRSRATILLNMHHTVSKWPDCLTPT